MNTHEELERQLRSALRATLDRELGPDPLWPESPAARRVAELDHRSRRGWPLRVLAVAALIGAGGGAALLGGRLNPAPEVSQDATNGWIAFTVGQPDAAGVDDDTDIWLVGLDQEPRRVIGTDTDGVDQLCPAFSPDGRSLAYGSVESLSRDRLHTRGARRAAFQNSTLVIADVADDGTVSDRLTIDVGDELPPPCPVWSPAGDQLAFGVPRTSPINPRGSGEGSEVWVVSPSDRGVSIVPDVLATDLDWSPDGSVLAIAGGVETAFGEGVVDGLQDARIHLYEPSSGTMRSLDDTLGVTYLTWSPDGRRIAYATIVDATGDHEHVFDSENELRIVDIETGEQEVIASAFRWMHGIGPVWSPDGETIAYQRLDGTSGEGHEVVLVTPDDRSERTGLAREVVISPDDTGRGLLPWRVTWSPDSKYLLYLAWSHPNGCCFEGMAEVISLVAVPTDLDAPSVLLADLDGIRPYDGGRDMTTFVPVQTWGRQPGSPRASSPEPTTTPKRTGEPTSKSTSDPTSAPTPEGLQTGPFVLWHGAEGAPTITVTIPAAGWYGVSGRGILLKNDSGAPPDGAGLIGPFDREVLVPEDPCQWQSTMPDTPATTVDEVIAALENQRSRDASEPVDITVNGYSGKSITLHVPDDLAYDDGFPACDLEMFCTLGTGNPEDPCSRNAQGPGQIEEVWVLDVGGMVVSIDGMYFPETPAQHVDEVRAILGSMTFDD